MGKVCSCKLFGGVLPREVHPALHSKQAALRRVQPVSFAVNKMAAAGSRGVMVQKSKIRCRRRGLRACAPA